MHAPYTLPQDYLRTFGLAESVQYVPVQGAGWSRAKQDWRQFKDDVWEGRRTLTEVEVEELVSIYDAEIRVLDDQIGALFAELKREEGSTTA